MLRRTPLVLALAVLGIALAFRMCSVGDPEDRAMRISASGETGDAVSEEDPELHLAAELHDRNAVLGGSRAPSAPLDARETGDGHEAADGPGAEPTGPPASLSGFVQDSREGPLPFHRIDLRGERRVHLVTTDKSGFYHVDALEGGMWAIHDVGSSRESVESYVFVEDIHVPSGTNVVHDIWIQGERILAGGFYLREDPDTVFELELRRAGTETIIGRGTTHPLTNARDEAQPTVPPEDVEPRERILPRGRFRFAHLHAGRYALRVIVARDPSSGEPTFFEREYDLSEEDVLFPPEALDWQEVFRECLLQSIRSGSSSLADLGLDGELPAGVSEAEVLQHIARELEQGNANLKIEKVENPR